MNCPIPCEERVDVVPTTVFLFLETPIGGPYRWINSYTGTKALSSVHQNGDVDAGKDLFRPSEDRRSFSAPATRVATRCVPRLCIASQKIMWRIFLSDCER